MNSTIDQTGCEGGYDARRRLYIRVAALVACVALTPATSWAQEGAPQDEAAFMGEDEGGPAFAGSAESGEGEDYWDPPVITPTGQPTRVSEAPSTTFIVTGDEVRRAGADTLPEVLRRVPGLEVRWIAGADGQIGPRGFAYELADRLLVLVDGRSAFIDFHGGTPYALLPVSPLDIERIEIVLGPGASVYGNKAMLGTIHIITKSPGEYPGLDVAASVGSSLDGMAAFRYGGGTGDWRSRVSGGANRRRSFDPDASQDALRSVFAVAELGYEPSPSRSLTLEGGVSHGQMSLIPTGSRVFPFEATLAHGKADGRLGLGGPGSPMGEIGMLLVWNEGWNSSTLFPADQGFSARYSTPYAELSHSLRYTLFDQPMHFRWGGEARLNRLQSTVTTNERRIFNVAGFASHEATLSSFKLTAGARLDRQTLTDVVVSPRVSLIFAPSEGHQLRAAFNTGYNNPNQIQLFSDFEAAPGARIVGQTDHRPERMVYGELGYSGVVASPVRVYANTFVYRMEDTIALNSAEVLMTGLSFYENNDPVDGFGGELGAEFNLRTGLKAYGHYAHVRLLARGDYPYAADNLGSPRHKVGAGLQYDTPEGVFATTDVQYFGASEVDRVPATPGSNTPFEVTELGAYAMAHGRLGFVPRKGMEASISATNLVGDATPHFPGGEIPRLRVLVNWSLHH